MTDTTDTTPTPLKRYRDLKRDKARLKDHAKTMREWDLAALQERRKEVLALFQAAFRRIAVLCPGNNVLGALHDDVDVLRTLMVRATVAASTDVQVTSGTMAILLDILDDLAGQIAALRASLGIPTP